MYLELIILDIEILSIFWNFVKLTWMLQNIMEKS